MLHNKQNIPSRFKIVLGINSAFAAIFKSNISVSHDLPS